MLCGHICASSPARADLRKLEQALYEYTHSQMASGVTIITLIISTRGFRPGGLTSALAPRMPVITEDVVA